MKLWNKIRKIIETYMKFIEEHRRQMKIQTQAINTACEASYDFPVFFECDFLASVSDAEIE